ncbi:MAG: hypothetical protein H6807_18075 [Planctomycetes bacterium]|nr:hypothetical protein [Planctomycetota bacterium]
MTSPGFLRFRWPLFLALASLAALPLDRLAVDLVNPDRPWPALDRFAIVFQDWSTRIEVALMVTGLLIVFLSRRLRGFREAMLTGVVAWIGVEGAVGVLKRVCGRPRPLHPDAALDFLRPLYDRPDLRASLRDMPPRRPCSRFSPLHLPRRIVRVVADLGDRDQADRLYVSAITSPTSSSVPPWAGPPWLRPSTWSRSTACARGHRGPAAPRQVGHPGLPGRGRLAPPGASATRRPERRGPGRLRASAIGARALICEPFLGPAFSWRASPT